MRIRLLCVLGVAAMTASCTSTTPPAPVAAVEPPPISAPTTQAELEQLRAENAKLRQQLYGAKQETAAAQNRVAAVEAKQKSIQRGKLEPGMTVQEASRAINGESTLHSDVVTLVSQNDNEWVYRILSGVPTNGPGSGGAAAVGTNMRGERAATAVAWVCTFDAKTGRLKAFKREE